MSGTSLDGLDLALVRFSKVQRWHFQIEAAQTLPYSENWHRRLQNALDSTLPGSELAALDAEYSALLAQKVNTFLAENSLAKKDIDFLSSHGHTLYHQPGRGFTLQLGKGAILSSLTGIASWSDFRTADIALGGQGAPLVPVGDALLFDAYPACLNLGGFSNISLTSLDKPVAFDICPVNIVLNRLANRLGKAYDAEGRIAARGEVDNTLFHRLEALPYYSEKAPKSLGTEWVSQYIWPLLENANLGEDALLATFTAHAASQIANTLKQHRVPKVLVSGGGAYNTHLIRSIEKRCGSQLVLPNPEIIAYKEALIFAFLGVLACCNEPNVYACFTGAANDHIGGSFHKAH